MKRILGFLFVSRSRKGVRRGIMFIFSNFLVLAGIVFFLEIAVILLGLYGVSIPLTRTARELLTSLLF